MNSATKEARKEARKKQREKETPRPRVEREVKLSDRDEFGLVVVTEEQIRCYVAVAFALRFDEPARKEWDEPVSLITKELGCDRRTVLSVFEKLEMSYTVEAGVRRKEGSGRPRLLEKNNKGLAAAAIGLNSNFSVMVATDICNQVNARDNIAPVSHNTVLRSLRAYTTVHKQSVLRRKTGSKDETSPWAIARLARCEMTLDMFDRERRVDAGDTTIEDCMKDDIPPAWMDGNGKLSLLAVMDTMEVLRSTSGVCQLTPRPAGWIPTGLFPTASLK